MKRNYPEKALRKHYKRASQYTQDQLLEVKPKNGIDTPVMVTNYNPSNPNIKQIIHNNWNIINNSPDCGTLFKDKPIIGFRRLPNLRDMLTNASIIYPQSHSSTKKTETQNLHKTWQMYLLPLDQQNQYSKM